MAQARRPGKRSFAAAGGGGPGPEAPVMELKPVEPKEEKDWQLWLSRGRRLFWHHPVRGGVQWVTPNDIRSDRLRGACVQKKMRGDRERKGRATERRRRREAGNENEKERGKERRSWNHENEQ